MKRARNYRHDTVINNPYKSAQSAQSVFLPDFINGLVFLSNITLTNLEMDTDKTDATD